jgi:hypothetical protein
MKKIISVLVLCFIAVGFVAAAPVALGTIGSIDWGTIKGAPAVVIVNNSADPQTIEYVIGKDKSAVVEIPGLTRFEIPYKGKEKADTAFTGIKVSAPKNVNKLAKAPTGTVIAKADEVTATAPAAIGVPASTATPAAAPAVTTTTAAKTDAKAATPAAAKTDTKAATPAPAAKTDAKAATPAAATTDTKAATPAATTTAKKK